MPTVNEVLRGDNPFLIVYDDEVVNVTAALKRQYTIKVYECDVCEWCGKVLTQNKDKIS